MKESRAASQGDRPSNVFDGDLVLADLGRNHAEKMERVGLIRLDGENLPVDLLGGLQPAALMVLDRNRQKFRSCRHLPPGQAIGLSIE